MENKEIIIKEKDIRNMFVNGDIECVKIDDRGDLIFVYLNSVHDFEMKSICYLKGLIYSVESVHGSVFISLHRKKVEELILKGYFR